MKFSFGAVVAVSLGLVFPAKTVVAEPFGLNGWRHDAVADHPLVGEIWSSESGTFVEDSVLLERMASQTIVILGEKHDNADHHRIQARIVQSLADTGARPSLVFEMLTDGQTDAIPQIYDPSIPWADLDKALTWSERGWPDWDSYRQIFGVARRSELPVFAGNPAQGVARDIGRDGLSSIPESERIRLYLNKPLPAEARLSLKDELLESHCGYLPESAVPGMAAVQRFRDARIADAVIKATGKGRPTILITGVGHMRKDRAVPYYLRQRVPGLPVVAIAIVEVERGVTDPAAYGEADNRDGPPLFDYLIFTPRVDEVDPCEKFKAQFKNMGG